jgi:hypothetical protein
VTEHVLKTLPDYWDAVARGDKNFEVRRDDRGFQKGDVLVLRYYEPGNEWKSRDDIRVRVLWILTGGQLGVEPGYVVMAIHKEGLPHAE